MSRSVKVAKLLLESGAVTVRPDEPFTYNSGIISPMYINNLVLISDPAKRTELLRAWKLFIQDRFPTLEAIAGTAGESITWTTWLADSLEAPMVYVRKRRKRHAHKNQIEGTLQPGWKTLMIESLVGTGSTAVASAETIRRAGGQPLGLVALFNYQLSTAARNFERAGLAVHSLTDFATLLDTASRQGLMSAENEAVVRDWQAKPVGWLSRRRQQARELV